MKDDYVDGARSTRKMPSVRRPQAQVTRIRIELRKGGGLLIPLLWAASLRVLSLFSWVLRLPYVMRWDRGLREN